MSYQKFLDSKYNFNSEKSIYSAASNLNFFKKMLYDSYRVQNRYVAFTQLYAKSHYVAFTQQCVFWLLGSRKFVTEQYLR